MARKRRRLVRRRPAESTAVGAAAGLLVAALLGVDDPALVTALGVVIGALPAVVTWFVVRAS